jgi:hypothetical protein
MYAQLDGRDENQSRPVRVETKISTLVPVLSTSGSSHAACACLCLVSPYTLRFDLQNILSHARTHTHTDTDRCQKWAGGAEPSTLSIC